MVLVNTLILSDFNGDMNNNQQHDWLIDDTNILTSDIDPYLTDYIISGTGDNQEVRIYALNSSFSNDNNQNSFDIPSMSTTESTYLTYGNFNFTFQNNFTTDYVIEDTNALEADDFIEFIYNEGTSSMKINTGENLTIIDFGNLVDDLSSNILLNSSNGVLNFTIASNFQSTTDIVPGGVVEFNRSSILGLISQFSGSIDENVTLTLKMYDVLSSSWKSVVDTFFIDTNLGTQVFENKFINENLNYINTSDISQIQFYFNRSDTTDFVLTLEEFELASTYGFALPISSSNQVALEFDLKGESSSVNGFYAWIRTLNLTKALTAELNITLYEANATIARTESNLKAPNLKPDAAKLIDSQIIDDYDGDSLSYFEFNTANTQNLGLSNYFIVIKSNQSDVFSLVTIPQQTYGDPDSSVDHQLRTSINNGATWNVARKQVPTTTTPYLSEILDAAAFKVNVTRAYMPSDFTNPSDSQDTLMIQDIPIINQINNNPPYDTSSSLTWGLGQWNYNFTTSITNNSLNNFQIDLTWNNSIIQGFKFNVTYTVKAFWIEQANSVYRVSYDTTPIWELNYTLNTGYKNFDNWNLLEFWYLFPDDYSAKNLTNPNSIEIYEDVVNKTGGEKILLDRPSYEFVSVSNDIINGISGIYSLNLTSSNLIYDMNSYINYNDILWKTNGFMYGDNISVQLDIGDTNLIPPIDGNATVVLFYPNNSEFNSTKVPGAELNSESGIISGNSLIYDFNNRSIYNVTNAIPVKGNYYLGFFWENGSAIGCQKLKLYIDNYDIEMNNLIFEPTLNQNILDGIIDKVYDEYSILISTVNVTDDKYYPSFYAVNKTDINQEFIHTVGDEDIPIIIESFLQNETILNPNENIRITTRIQNNHDFIDIKLRLNVQLVSLANQEWIIAEQTTDLKTLKPNGAPNDEDTQDFSVDISMPTLLGDGIWHGVNAPIRKGGAKTRVTVFIEYGGESYEIDTFESNEYSLIVNSTEDEFEGYIIALKSDNDITGASILKPFERDECQYLPNQTTFVINIYDRNYISSYNQFIESFSLKINSDFSEIQTFPQTPIYGKFFNLTSVLKTELGDVIPNKNVTCQFYDSGIWENLSTQISDIDGTTNFEIDTLSLPSDDQFKFRLTWQGDQYTLENSRNVTVLMYRALNDVSLGLRSNIDQIFRNAQLTVQVTLSNIGDSELRVLVPSISIGINPSLNYSIVEIDYLTLERFKPGDITIILISINVPAIDQMNMSVSISVKNDITDEEHTFQVSKLFEIYDVQLVDYLLNLFTLIMISIFILVWAIMYFYVKRTIKIIETPYEEPYKKKARKGRYVSVSELPKEKIPEAQPIDYTEKKSKKKSKKKKKKKQPEPDKKDKPASTDLDSLLEEKGLKD